MSPQIFEPLDRGWLHLLVTSWHSQGDRDGVYHSGCMAALQGAGSNICNLTAVLIVEQELQGQSAWQGCIRPFGSS